MMKAPRFLVVDENNRPMAWHDRSKQLCYCETIRKSAFKATSYTKEVAEVLIDKTKKNRKSWNMSEGQYFLMPFN